MVFFSFCLISRFSSQNAGRSPFIKNVSCLKFEQRSKKSEVLPFESTPGLGSRLTLCLVLVVVAAALMIFFLEYPVRMNERPSPSCTGLLTFNAMNFLVCVDFVQFKFLFFCIYSFCTGMYGKCAFARSELLFTEEITSIYCA